MAPFIVFLAGPEKDTKEMQKLVEAAKRSVGPMKIFSAYKPAEGVSTLREIPVSHLTYRGSHLIADTWRSTRLGVGLSWIPALPYTCVYMHHGQRHFCHP
jgi:hypothetical protein